MRFDQSNFAQHQSNRMRDSAPRRRIDLALVALSMLCFGGSFADAQGQAQGQAQGCTQTVFAKGVLVVDAARPIAVVSTEHGRTSINGFVPSAPAKPPSLEEVAAMVQQVKQKNPQVENKELIHFRGERTPLATVLPLTPLRPSRVNPIVPTGPENAPAGGADDQGPIQPPTPPATVHPDDH